LPQLADTLFLTDGGLETTLVFHEGIELRDFAAFPLLDDPDGERALRAYYRTYADLAARFGTGLILESATWRANADWGARLGYGPAELADANRRALALLEEIRGEYEARGVPVVVSGCVGPRGDGYVPDRAMSADDAAVYHRPQVETFAGAGADMVSAMTMNYVDEAVGVAHAAGTPASRWPSPSPWRPTARFRPVRPSERRSRRWTTPHRDTPRTTW
jgi:homocysteine S-methyltransferase